LNVKRACVLEEGLNAKLILTPRKVPTPPNMDTSGKCQDHYNFS